MNWRLLIENSVSDSYGLAADEILTKRVGQNKSLPILRLYTYKSHCALAGRFQNIENEINLKFCNENNIAFNRRPTGGGAIIMGEDQLGIALMIPAKSQDNFGNLKQVMKKFSAGIIDGLNYMGLSSAFMGKNDIEVEGKKLAGLGLYRDAFGGLLFHASVLLDMNIDLMLKTLITPFEKISDKSIQTVQSRISALRWLLSENITMDDLIKSVKRGYESAFDIKFESQNLTEDELNEIHNLQLTKYGNNDWIFQSSGINDYKGNAKCKTDYGLIDININVAGQTIKNIFIGGDFFAAEAAIAELESNLKWHPCNADKIAETINDIYLKYNGELSSLPEIELNETIIEAIKNASEFSKTYGCFVNPGGSNG